MTALIQFPSVSAAGLLRLLLLGLALWLPASPALALFGFTQQKTTEWVVEKVQGFLPGELSYDSIQGPLKSPIEFQGLRYQDGELVVTIDTLVMEWSLPRLLLGTARVERVFVDGVRVKLPPAVPAEEAPVTEEPAGPVLPDISLPIKLDLRDVNIQDIRVVPAEGVPIQIDAVELAAETEDSTVVIDKLRLLAPQGSLALAGTVNPTGAYPVDLNLEWNYQPPELAAVQGQGQLSGALGETLSLTQTFDGAVQGQLQAQVGDPIEDLNWQAQLELAALELGLLDPQMTGNDLSGQLSSEGSLEDYQAQARFTTTLPDLGRTVARFQARGGTDTLVLEELTVEAADGPLALEAQAAVDLQNQTVDATGQWQALAWPLVGEPAIESPSGEFAVQGTFQDYRARLAAAVRGEAFGTVNAQLAAQGTDQQVQIQELLITAPDRVLELAAQGSYGFAENRFDGQGRWQNLVWPLVGEPVFASPRGEFSAQGTPRDFLAQLEAALESSDYGRVTARLEAAGTGEVIELRQLSLTDPDGPLALQAQGRYGFDSQLIEAQGQWQNLAWPLLGEPVVESPAGEFEAQGTLQDYQGRLQATVAGDSFGRLATDLTVQGSDQVVRLTALEVRDPDTELALNAEAELALANLAFQASGNWRNAAWPLAGDEPKVVESPSGSFTAQGT
ncbi:MAG: hypothetical protein R3310_04965, partial [Candidatus Competibacteraceae bacterium]|nr:hypothetical protein [Candidatus Competibacteraceae bacterium]